MPRVLEQYSDKQDVVYYAMLTGRTRITLKYRHNEYRQKQPTYKYQTAYLLLLLHIGKKGALWLTFSQYDVLEISHYTYKARTLGVHPTGRSTTCRAWRRGSSVVDEEAR